MSDLIKIADSMKVCINELEALRLNIGEYANNKAISLAEYEKEIAKTIIGLRNGKEFDLDGEKIVNPPVSIIEKIAKGICWELKMQSDFSETKYKSTIVKIDTIKAQLNGYQSINRHLEDR